MTEKLSPVVRAILASISGELLAPVSTKWISSLDMDTEDAVSCFGFSFPSPTWLISVSNVILDDIYLRFE
jgi:hypothetical protein